MKTVKQPAEVLFKSLDFADKIVMLPIIDRFANAIRTNCDISIMELNSHDNRTTEITIDNAKKMFKILSDLGCRTSLGESYEDIVKSDNSQDDKKYYILRLHNFGEKKLDVIHILGKQLNISLASAKDLVEACPINITLRNYAIKPDDYEKLASSLNSKGAYAEIITSD